MTHNTKLYERFLSLSEQEKQLLQSAASDQNSGNGVSLAKIYLGDAPLADITAFLRQLRQSS